MPNTFTNLHFHVVFSTKNRAPLREDLVSRTRQYLGGCFQTLRGTALRVGGADHVHALIRLKPTHTVSDVLRDVKRESSEWLRETIPSFHWQDGYSAFTVSASQLDRVARYIEMQEQHHARKTFAEELREILIANGIAFDERYLV